MERRKFIVAGYYWQANEYVHKHNFRINDFKIACEPHSVIGYDAKKIEFILICNYWDNRLYKDYIYQECLQHGAIESHDELHPRD